MDAPQEAFYPDHETGAMTILFKVIGRRSWDDLHGWRDALPGSRIEHVMEGTGLFVLHVPPGGAGEIAA
jgi:hypothetical protein